MYEATSLGKASSYLVSSLTKGIVNCIISTYPLIFQLLALCAARGHPGALPPVLDGTYFTSVLPTITGLRKTFVTLDKAYKNVVYFVTCFTVPRKLSSFGNVGEHSTCIHSPVPLGDHSQPLCQDPVTATVANPMQINQYGNI